MIDIGEVPTTDQAQLVLDAFRYIAKCDEQVRNGTGYITVKHYCNGREQGIYASHL